MRILVLSKSYPTRNEPNSGIFIHRQVRALVELGVHCDVLQPIDWAPPPPLHNLHPTWRNGSAERADALAEVDGVAVHHPRVFHPKPSRFFPGDHWERVGRATAAFVERRSDLARADLMYAQFLCHEGYAGLVATRRLAMPLVAAARGDDVHLWPQRWPDRRQKLAAVLREAEGLIACSQALATDAKGWATEGGGDRIEVVYNGVDAHGFRPARDHEEQMEARRALGLPLDGRLLLCVGKAVPQKGWSEMLEAFAEVEDRLAAWSLISVLLPMQAGANDFRAEIERRAAGHRFVPRGPVSPESMPLLYRAVDAFVSPSHNEGLSNALVEAMASGLPVVATHVGGHAEIVEHGVSGLLVPPRDHRALGRALLELLLDDARAAAAGRAARAAAQRLGDQRAAAARLVGCFEGVLARRPSSPQP